MTRKKLPNKNFKLVDRQVERYYEEYKKASSEGDFDRREQAFRRICKVFEDRNTYEELNKHRISGDSYLYSICREAIFTALEQYEKGASPLRFYVRMKIGFAIQSALKKKIKDSFVVTIPYKQAEKHRSMLMDADRRDRGLEMKHEWTENDWYEFNFLEGMLTRHAVTLVAAEEFDMAYNRDGELVPINEWGEEDETIRMLLEQYESVLYCTYEGQ